MELVLKNKQKNRKKWVGKSLSLQISSNPSAWFEAQPEVRLSAGKEVLGGWGGTYLMLLASATAAGKEEVEEESFMGFVSGPRMFPGTQPSAAGDWLLAGR